MELHPRETQRLARSAQRPRSARRLTGQNFRRSALSLRRPPRTDPRQASRPRPMALYLRNPQPAQAVPRRWPGDPEHQLKKPWGALPNGPEPPREAPSPSQATKPSPSPPPSRPSRPSIFAAHPRRDPIATHAPSGLSQTPKAGSPYTRSAIARTEVPVGHRRRSRNVAEPTA